MMEQIFMLRYEFSIHIHLVSLILINIYVFLKEGLAGLI